MFDPSDRPRVFGVPLGVDFPKALLAGLDARLASAPPEALARVQLIVNTRRMARRIRALFDAGPPRLLPRVQLITDLGENWDLAAIPDPVSPLQRRLELVHLVARLLDRAPDLAPRSSLFDLTDSLAGLMDEMHGEGVPPEELATLDISDQSGHWDRIKAFLDILRPYFETGTTQPDVETRQRQVVEHLASLWQDHPPEHPVIVAGSSGSRGATQLLMRAVANLPQGAVILPGFDFDMPDHVWGSLEDPMLSEDHPQFRFSTLMRRLGLGPEDIRRWSGDTPASPARNRLISLALRPAPVTDQWLEDGPKLTAIKEATENVTLVEAPSLRAEALAIALRLRHAAEEGRTAALITPDRTITRQVTAALDRWGIIPDDSAGVPLPLSPPGRFLRHVADLFAQPLTAEALLTLLKHPLTHSGAGRGPHLLRTRDLELHLRRNGPPNPRPADLAAWAAERNDPATTAWAAWVRDCFTGKQEMAEAPLDSRVTRHLSLAERIAQGADGPGAGQLWQAEAGRKAAEVVGDLRASARHGGHIGASDYASLFQSVLARHEVRNPEVPHPRILIWGTLEARVHGADLLILAGLNEGTWPEPPAPDPWLNRTLRNRVGLLLPERRIGLSAHDFQQAVTAPEIWMTRAIRSDDAQTVPARWLNRVQNLLGGLQEQGGPAALEGMRARGAHWLTIAEALEAPEPTAPEARPAPCPPVTARPTRLSVTEIKKLIRDPYAIYARHVLRLRPLDPLMKVPDALLRGIVLHSVLEGFIKDARADPARLTRDHLMDHAESVLAENVPWAEARAMWQARLDRVADRFIAAETARQRLARPLGFEVSGTRRAEALDFALSATADRIDVDTAGALHLYDYKTGAPPSQKEQRFFDKQLLLEAAIAEQGGFGEIGALPVASATFLGLGPGAPEVSAPLSEEPPAKVWADLEALIAAYQEPGRGYPARRAMHSTRERGDYDDLARFGEWDITDPPRKTEVR